MTSFLGCSAWEPANHLVYHVASGMVCVGLLVPESKYGALLLHGLMCVGFLLLSVWSWVILCAPDFFSWNLTLLILNGVQTLSILYSIRPIRFPPDLEDVYVSLFKPLRVHRVLYKRMVSPEFCTLMTLNDGEAYAIQSVTRTDKLGLLVSGVMHAYSNHGLLHAILERHFIDSPEFESTLTGDDKFQVSIVASGTCSYLIWPRQSLEYLLAKEPYLAHVMKTLIGRDITNKLYALNEKVATPTGSRLDIRLPSIPRILKHRKDLRRALVGAMDHDVLVTDREDAADSEPENDLRKQSDAGESCTVTCDGRCDTEIQTAVTGSQDSGGRINNLTVTCDGRCDMEIQKAVTGSQGSGGRINNLTVTCDGRCDTEIQKAVTGSQDSGGRINTLMNKRNIRTKTRLGSLERCVWSLLVPGLQCWTMSSAMVKKLLAAEMGLLRRMLPTQRRMLGTQRRMLPTQRRKLRTQRGMLGTQRGMLGTQRGQDILGYSQLQLLLNRLSKTTKKKERQKERHDVDGTR